MNNIIRAESATQLEMFDPVEITRPDVNIGRSAGRIFASPYARDLDQPKVFTWEVDRGGEKAKASLTITPLMGKKRPTTTTLKVYLGLTQLWELAGKPENGEIVFSARQMAHILHWRWSGKNVARRIQDHLTILKGTQIDWLRSYTRDSKVETRVQEMNIISDRSYIEREDSLRSDLFISQQTVMLNQRIVENMLAGNTKPVNYDAFLSIKNESCANLYTLLDSYLSQKRRWERRSLGLIREELFLGGTRYDQRFARHELLKRFVLELDGKELSSGKLQVWIEETKDKTDWKFVAAKIPRTLRKGRIPPKQANPSEDIPYIIEDIVEGLSQLGTVHISSTKIINVLARWYPRQMLFDVLSLLKGDYRGLINKSPIRAYMYLVHVEAHKRSRDWIKECDKSCRHRPENRLSLKAFMSQKQGR